LVAADGAVAGVAVLLGVAVADADVWGLGFAGVELSFSQPVKAPVATTAKARHRNPRTIRIMKFPLLLISPAFRNVSPRDMCRGPRTAASLRSIVYRERSDHR
jgi:hypothetical protein